MDSKRVIIGAAWLAAACLLAGSAQAQGDPARVGVGGHYTLSRNTEFDETSHMVGGQLRIRGPVFGVEGAVDYRSEELVSGVDLKTWPVTASALIYPIPMLYGLAGVGWYHSTLAFDTDLIDDQTSSEIGYHVGAGAELPVAAGLALAMDVRWVFIEYDFDRVDEFEDLGNADSDYMTAHAGILYYFGGP